MEQAESSRSRISLGAAALEVYPLPEIQRFIRECLVALDTPERHADEVAQVLVFADYIGATADGLLHLDSYIKEIREGTCDKNATPRIVKESPATCLVDGKNSLGAVVGNFCMNVAMKKAKAVGIGWVVAKGSNRIGDVSYFSKQALNEGLVGLTFTNTSPLVAPTNSQTRALGTNPISVTAPGQGDDCFVLNMATSVVRAGKIEVLSKMHAPVPETWADAKSGALYPLGGESPHYNFKGYGLAMMVEIFCGILSGSSYGMNVRRYGNYHQAYDLGQCFVAVNPLFFEPGFPDRMQDLMDQMRRLEPLQIDRKEPVMVHGDRERRNAAQVEAQGGVRYSKSTVDMCVKWARALKVAPLRPRDE